MEKKPLAMVAKDAKDAAYKLNEYVEKADSNLILESAQNMLLQLVRILMAARKKQKKNVIDSQDLLIHM